MNENGDLIPIEKPNEINTYNIPELEFDKSDEKTQCFNTNRSTRKRSRIIYRSYSFLCVIAVLLTLIFSASEIIRFTMNDTGAADALIKHFWGYRSDQANDENALVELIMNKTFIDLKPKKNEPPDTTPDSLPDQDLPSAEESAPPPADTEDDLQNESPEIVPEPNDSLSSIISMDLSLLSYGKNYIYNDTSLYFNIEDFRSAALTDRYDESSDAPLVLIIHTHTGEAFMPDGATQYKNEGEISRSNDPSKNMIAVGAEFARVLEENGIRTLHCTIVHDESYSLSYQRSAETVLKYLREYPSIQYVFDLHRDSILRSSGELVKAVTSIDGEACAQIMPVVSAGFDGYEENLSFAIKLRDSLNEEYTNLSRPICVRTSIYNQDLAPVSILLEMGTSGNSLPEVLRSAAITAQAVADLIKQ